MKHTDIINFWFKEITPEQWYKKDAAFDALIKERFTGIHQQAAQGELDDWRTTAEGSLAEIIVLDQFSRNMFRNQAQAFACDAMALTLSQLAIAKGFDQVFGGSDKKAFLYMPFMHSESKKIHQRAEQLFAQEGLESGLKYEMLHKSIIGRFGRYPHRNEALGRESTKEELAFLKEPNSSF